MAQADDPPEIGRLFGFAVADYSHVEKEFAFVVAAPGPYLGKPGGGLLYFFEGDPPRHVRTASGDADHALAEWITVVTVDGEPYLFLRGAKNFIATRGDLNDSHIYSFGGAVVRTFFGKDGVRMPIGDVTGDGTTDYCRLGGQDRRDLRWFDGKDETVLRAVLLDVPAFMLGTIGDLDGDGLPEALVWLEDGDDPLNVFMSGPLGGRLALKWAGLSSKARPSLQALFIETDSASSGSLPILILGAPSWRRPTGRVVAFDLRDGEMIYDIEDRYGHVVQWGDGNSQRIGTLLGNALLGISDIDGDGVPDLIASSPNDGVHARSQVHAFSGLTGQLLWTHIADGDDPTYIGTSLALIPDFNADGVADVLVGGADLCACGPPRRVGSLRVLSAVSGELVWRFDEKSL